MSSPHPSLHPAKQHPSINQVPLGRWVTNCSAPLSVHWLLPGNWSLEINATDEAGNTSPTPATARWRVAFEPNTPYVRFTAGTLGVTNRNSTRFQLTTLSVRIAAS